MERARDAVRKLKSKRPNRDILVLVRGGRHFLKKTLVFSLADSVSNIIAPAAAGILIGVIGIVGVLTIDIITFLVAVGILLVVKIPQPVKSKEKRSILGDIFFGFKYISERRGLLGLQLFWFASNLVTRIEKQRTGEAPRDLAARLACAKAESVGGRYPQTVVIGSDQVAVLGPQVLGKPGTVARFIEQLRRSSGREVVFFTAVHVLDGHTGRSESHVDRTVVKFRELAEPEIERYVAADHPLDCAGGFKVEARGVALFERIESEDPTGLTGLPLIWLCGALRRAGIPVP